MGNASRLTEQVPTIDISALRAPRGNDAEQLTAVDRPVPNGTALDAAALDAAAQIGAAGREFGFFQIVGHGVDPSLRERLRRVAEEFFSLDEEEKARVAMDRGGRAWRGWFELGGELTSGVPDGKEGYYFGINLPPEDPRVVAGVPLHGPNLYPDRPAELGEVVEEWMRQVTAAGRAVLRGIALSFDLDAGWFDRWLVDPVVLFRMFHYPPPPPGFAGRWGVAEHTDYGLLTLLVQDDTGGLEVLVDDRWVEVPPQEDAIVCNLGDMLERVTGGVFRSTPHRVRLPDRDRYSFPLFLDPSWDAVPEPLPGCEPSEEALASGSVRRWDGRSVFDAEGTYGDYLLEKVSKVFPDLFDEQIGGPD